MVLSATANAIAGLEHHNRLAVAVQLNRRGQSGEPGADDRDVNLPVATPVSVRATQGPGRASERSSSRTGGRGADELAASKSRFGAQGAQILPARSM